MNGLIKKIKDIFPVTTTKAVYMDGTNKTLQEAIDDGTVGGTSSVTAVGVDDTRVTTTQAWSSSKVKTYVGYNVKDAYVRSGIIQLNCNMFDKTVTFGPRSNGTTMDKQIYIHFHDGGVATPNLPDSTTLSHCQYLKWSQDNGFSIGSNDYGFSLAANEVLIASNHNGVIDGGILSEIFFRDVPTTISNYYEPSTYGKIPLQAGLHCLTFVDDCVWTFDKPVDGSKAYFYNNNNEVITSKTMNFVESDNHVCGMICIDYNQNNGCMIMGNGDGFGNTGIMRGYIFYEPKSWLTAGENTITFDNCGEYVLLDFTDAELFPKDYKCHLVWGQQNDDRNDIVYLVTTHRQQIYKLQLGKGANQLDHGIFVEGLDNSKYNGTYRILKEWQQTITTEANKDCQYYNGVIYSSVKRMGGCVVHKQYLKPNGSIGIEEIRVNPLKDDGTSLLNSAPEGLAINNGKIYCTVAGSKDLYYFDII